MILTLQKAEVILFTLKKNLRLSYLRNMLRKQIKITHITVLRSVNFTLVFLHAYLFYIIKILLYREF